jgi:MIP family channel proteins
LKNFLPKALLRCWRSVLAEAIGTFILVFAGTGAMMVNQISQGAITHVGISFVFGAVVTALIYSMGHMSGSHFNPAVTLALWTSGFFPTWQVFQYIFAQLFGAVAASFILLISLGKIANLGATLPLDGNWLQSLVLETILTLILMFVIFASGLDKRAHVGFAPLAIGLTVGLEALFMGPITGASMNPARSFGPAFVGGIWQYHWVYWIGPIFGGQLAVLLYSVLKNEFRDIN